MTHATGPFDVPLRARTPPGRPRFPKQPENSFIRIWANTQVTPTPLTESAPNVFHVKPNGETAKKENRKEIP